MILCYSSSVYNFIQFQCFQNNEFSKEYQIAYIEDDLSIGSIYDVLSEERLESLSIIYKEEEIEAFKKTMPEIYTRFLASLNNESHFTIFYSNSPFEYCGMLFTCWYLSIHNPDCHLTFSNITEILGYSCCNELRTFNEIQKCIKQARILDFKKFAETWENLRDENKQFRFPIHEQLTSVNSNYLDKEIKILIANKDQSDSWQLAAEIHYYYRINHNISLNVNFLHSRICKNNT